MEENTNSESTLCGCKCPKGTKKNLPVNINKIDSFFSFYYQKSRWDEYNLSTQSLTKYIIFEMGMEKILIRSSSSLMCRICDVNWICLAPKRVSEIEWEIKQDTPSAPIYVI